MREAGGDSTTNRGRRGDESDGVGASARHELPLPDVPMSPN